LLEVLSERAGNRQRVCAAYGFVLYTTNEPTYSRRRAEQPHNPLFLKLHNLGYNLLWLWVAVAFSVGIAWVADLLVFLSRRRLHRLAQKKWSKDLKSAGGLPN
jgi:hypothetical protein